MKRIKDIIYVVNERGDEYNLNDFDLIKDAIRTLGIVDNKVMIFSGDKQYEIFEDLLLEHRTKHPKNYKKSGIIFRLIKSPFIDPWSFFIIPGVFEENSWTDIILFNEEYKEAGELFVKQLDDYIEEIDNRIHEHIMNPSKTTKGLWTLINENQMETPERVPNTDHFIKDLNAIKDRIIQVTETATTNNVHILGYEDSDLKENAEVEGKVQKNGFYALLASNLKDINDLLDSLEHQVERMRNEL